MAIMVIMVSRITVSLVEIFLVVNNTLMWSEKAINNTIKLQIKVKLISVTKPYVDCYFKTVILMDLTFINEVVMGVTIRHIVVVQSMVGVVLVLRLFFLVHVNYLDT